MPRFILTGGRAIGGTLRIPGAKNAALPILAASILAEEPIALLDCPKLRDVENMRSILQTLGCTTRWEGQALWIDPSSACGFEMPQALSKELRSSIFMLGPLLARFGKAVATFPGGCEIGLRPIDLHLKALRALGVEIKEEGGRILCDGSSMRGGMIHLDYPSVGATENAMMAAVAAQGDTCIYNAAREPEIEDLQRFLNTLGFSVSGAGGHSIHIRGGERKPQRFDTYRILPDRITAGTYLCAAAMTGGDICLTNTRPEQLGCVLDKLRECGCSVQTEQGTIRLKAPKRLGELKLVETLPYPGFPTDLQAQMLALCTVADGVSVIVENVFENRFKHAGELARMGACCTVKDRMAVVRGVERLKGARVDAPDLRGGAALVLAGLCAEGETVVEHVQLIDRGYQAMEQDLASLGAKITREEDGA